MNAKTRKYVKRFCDIVLYVNIVNAIFDLDIYGFADNSAFKYVIAVFLILVLALELYFFFGELRKKG